MNSQDRCRYFPVKVGKFVASGRYANLNGRVRLTDYFPTCADLAAEGASQAELHQRAVAATRSYFGRAVFVRAVVEVSNHCRENCAYCGMRRDNRKLHRFRARQEQLRAMLLEHCPPSVTDINIQAGEDPVAVREIVLPLVRTLRQERGVGVSVCLGTLSAELYSALREAGASIYIMKFECGDPVQYRRFEAPGTLEERVQHLRLLAANGWKVSSGFIVGLPGQTLADVQNNLALARTLPLHGCSVSPFIPGNETPLAGAAAAEPAWTLNAMAALRLMRPDWVIPAVSALNLMERDGYRHGLQTGANLVTINLTPDEMRDDYVIYKRDRFIMTEERVLSALAAEGLEPSGIGLAEYYQAQDKGVSLGGN